MNDFQGDGKQVEKSRSNMNLNEQNFATQDTPHTSSIFTQGKRSNSGQIATEENGKWVVYVLYAILLDFS